MIRLGLCCTFRDAPIKFRTTTATALARQPRETGLAKLGELCLANADSLLEAFRFCASRGIGCFRIGSQVLPLKTHPQAGYLMDDLPRGADIVDRFRAAGDFARSHGLRSCFHPDQFVVLNSRRPEVVASSLQEIEYQAEVAEWVGADVVNIHGGGAFGDKPSALDAFARAVDRLSPRARSRLTVENDDTVYTPADLLPVCRSTGVPLVYDAHHHRVLPDGMSIEESTAAALSTWTREPMFHLSSPIEGWRGPYPERHHDYIAPADFPRCWLGLTATVEVEAKAKEAAVLRLKRWLERPAKRQ